MDHVVYLDAQAKELDLLLAHKSRWSPAVRPGEKCPTAGSTRVIPCISFGRWR